MPSLVSSHEELIITKRGKPIAHLVAANGEHNKVNLCGSVLAEKDIMKPVDKLWEAISLMTHSGENTAAVTALA